MKKLILWNARMLQFLFCVAWFPICIGTTLLCLVFQAITMGIWYKETKFLFPLSLGEKTTWWLHVLEKVVGEDHWLFS